MADVTSGCDVGGQHHALTIVIASWTRVVPIGTRGQVNLAVLNTFPVTQIQVKFGAQVVGEINGDELRDVQAVGFAVPSQPMDYPLFVAAQDSTGCDAITTVARTVTVQ